ncbi:MAG: hypothetical protein P1V36_15410, partial [Planctomycetota bacterium]|nr:hypothetical protein [Planctomycetota bacterium]
EPQNPLMQPPMQPDDTPPTLPTPREPDGTRRYPPTVVRALRIEGSGRIVLRLRGTGRVVLQRGRFDDFSFEGRGIPKHVSALRVHLDGVEGLLTLEGTELSLEFSGGTAEAEYEGTFEVKARAA